MASAGTAGTVTAGAGAGQPPTKESAPGTTMVDYMIPIMAAYMGAEMVTFTLNFSDELGQLFFLALVCYMLSLAPAMALQWWAHHDDGRVDRYEKLFLTLAELCKWLLFFITTGFFFLWLNSLLTGYALPPWYQALALASVLILAVFALLPYFINTVAAAAPNLNGSASGTAGGVVAATADAAIVL